MSQRNDLTRTIAYRVLRGRKSTMEETKKGIVILESLKIDSLKSKWFARFLFLLVFSLFSLTRLFPIGDNDFSRVYAWIKDYSEAESSEIMGLGLPVITAGNMINIGVEILLIFLYIFIAFLYLSVYLSDQLQLTTRAGLLRYVKKFPALLLFVMLMSLLFAFPTMTFPPLILLVLPPVFLVPSIIVQENKTFAEAIMASIRRTYGIKLPIFISILFLVLCYSSFAFLFIAIIGSKEYMILLEGFIRAYFVLSFGRLFGIMYDASIIRDALAASREK